MKRNNLTRRVLGMLLAALLFLTGTLPASADDTQTLSDARWSNGSYSATLGDMAGRRLYVYGIADSLGEGAEPETDSGIVLAADADITRLEAAMLLYRLCGTEEEISCPFTDVPEIYLPAVSWLYAAGITRGISAEQYGTGYLTRAQFLTMLSRQLAWESAASDAEWNEAVFEAELSGQARENNLLPAGVHDEGLKHGDVYLILLALMQKYFPEKQTPVRAEMSLPDQITRRRSLRRRCNTRRTALISISRRTARRIKSLNSMRNTIRTGRATRASIPLSRAQTQRCHGDTLAAGWTRISSSCGFTGTRPRIWPGWMPPTGFAALRTRHTAGVSLSFGKRRSCRLSRRTRTTIQRRGKRRNWSAGSRLTIGRSTVPSRREKGARTRKHTALPAS